MSPFAFVSGGDYQKMSLAMRANIITSNRIRVLGENIGGSLISNFSRHSVSLFKWTIKRSIVLLKTM